MSLVNVFRTTFSSKTNGPVIDAHPTTKVKQKFMWSHFRLCTLKDITYCWSTCRQVQNLRHEEEALQLGEKKVWCRDAHFIY